MEEDFYKELYELYLELTNNQQRLGHEFEKAIFENVEDLYEN